MCVCVRVLYDMNIFLQHLAQNDGNKAAEDAFKYLTEEEDEGCENRETQERVAVRGDSRVWSPGGNGLW